MSLIIKDEDEYLSHQGVTKSWQFLLSFLQLIRTRKWILLKQWLIQNSYPLNICWMKNNYAGGYFIVTQKSQLSCFIWLSQICLWIYSYSNHLWSWYSFLTRWPDSLVVSIKALVERTLSLETFKRGAFVGCFLRLWTNNFFGGVVLMVVFLPWQCFLWPFLEKKAHVYLLMLGDLFKKSFV